MLSATQSLLCFDAMRKRGSFTVADIVKAGFRDFEVRALLRYWVAQGAVEIQPVRATRGGRHVTLHRTLVGLPPLIVAQDEDRDALREMLIERFGARLARPETIAAQRQMWVALRTLRVSDARQIAFSASTEAQSVSTGAARSYLARLVEHGYAAALPDAQFRMLPAKSGPFPALIARGVVLDLNLLTAVKVNSQPSLNAGRAA